MKYLKLIALTLVAAGTWWLAFIQEPDAQDPSTKSGHKIDYFLKDFDVISMTLTGQRKQRVQATYMQHFVDDDSTFPRGEHATAFLPALFGHLEELPRDKGKLLHRRDDDRHLVLQCFGELPGAFVDLLHHALAMLELINRVLELLIQH